MIDLKSYRVKPENMGIPDFHAPDILSKNHKRYTLFDLSSHARAKDAIAFGLKVRDSGFHVFVVGEDRSGRMTATMGYLENYIKTLPSPSDWIYLNNFKQQHKPLPFKLPNGMGCKIHKAMKEHIKNIETILKKTFTSPSYLKQIDKISSQLDQQTNEDLDRVKEFAQRYQFEVLHGPEGFHIQDLDHDDSGEPPLNGKSIVPKGASVSDGPPSVKNPKKKKRDTQIAQIKDQLNRLTLNVSLASRNVIKQIKILQETLAINATKTLWQKFRYDHSKYLNGWIDDFEADVLDNIELFLEDEDSQQSNHYERYAVNLFIDNQHHKHPRVFLESIPTFENLFGSIKNRVSQSGTYETNFTMIRPGSMHKANGGILVLRAEALAADPDVWEHFKAVLRDKKIRIKEHGSEHMSSPLIDAPAPKAIPLDIQVFVVGQPLWYYSFFFNDPEFRIYFKIKADIDPDLEINPPNIQTYCGLVKQTAEETHTFHITPEAIHYLTQCSARWAAHRGKFSGRFELIGDVLAEAMAFAKDEQGAVIEKSHIRKTLLGRRIRNSRTEDRAYAEILNGTILIDTENQVVGQVNGLTVVSSGDHDFGLPARISARTYIGQHGVINIERLTDMSGPIQQKGAFILDGFLSSQFAQKFPLSFSCSLTFEQNYGDVEGDSASMAELCAILSSLADVPLRQDIAITGSVNQFGMAQAVGGIHHKIEGFFEICRRRGLTGHQGVIIPSSNLDNLTVKDEVVEAVEQGLFHIYSVSNVFEALDILTGLSSSIQTYFWGTRRTGVFSKSYAKLEYFHKILTK
ncbi:MAG: AAA family ATPase [Alphaproteobacteria bacterium]|nr:AAA family ATPase [Alphaproteobacteria bacterium]